MVRVRDHITQGDVGIVRYEAKNPDGTPVNETIFGYQYPASRTLNWLVDSVANPNWRQKISRNEMVGSIFTTRYWEYQSNPVSSYIWRGGPLEESYRGPLHARDSWQPGNFEHLVPSPVNDVGLLGAKFYNEMRPNKADFSGLNALIELKDLPRMLNQRLRTLKDINDWYLAVTFGWLPLLDDIRSMVKTQQQMQKKLNFLIKNEGKPLRRRSRVKYERTDLFDNSYEGYWCIQPGNLDFFFYKSVPKLREVAYTDTSYWASARFVYVLPPGPRDILWKARMLGLLFGLNVTPAAVWNALPWSWLVDWFSNAGDVAQNLSEGLEGNTFADQFYLMAHRRRVIEYVAEGQFATKDGGTVTVNPSARNIAGIKTRSLGDPFGIAFTEDQLSVKQWSILGALGYSRL